MDTTTDEATVLLDDAVADFQHLSATVASHSGDILRRGATEAVYPQPYCYLTTLLVQMHAAGWTAMDFDTLAVVSGASAMFGYESDEFMPKYAFHWRDPNRLVAEATGYVSEGIRASSAEQAWEIVRASIDSGAPVAGWHGELMLLAGYRAAAAIAERKVFAMKDGNGRFAEWWTWAQFAEWVGDGQQLSRHAGRAESQPPRAVALRVLRDLVALSGGVPEKVRQAFPRATFGLAGIAAWADDCADLAKHPDWGMCHPENPQWTVRNSTAVYLERVAGQRLLDEQATAHVQRAAQLYRLAYAGWQAAYGLVGYAAPDGSGRVPEKRAAAAAAVRRALEAETAAIGALRDALATADNGTVGRPQGA